MYVYRARIGHRGAVKRKGGIRYQLRNFSIPPLTWRFELTRIGDGVAPVVFRHFDAAVSLNQKVRPALSALFLSNLFAALEEREGN